MGILSSRKKINSWDFVFSQAIQMQPIERWRWLERHVSRSNRWRAHYLNLPATSDANSKKKQKNNSGNIWRSVTEQPGVDPTVQNATLFNRLHHGRRGILQTQRRTANCRTYVQLKKKQPKKQPKKPLPTCKCAIVKSGCSRQEKTFSTWRIQLH